MTRDEFIMVLAKNNIDPNIVCFDENIKDGYCIRKCYYRWETLVRERGQEYDVRGFPSESDALKSLSEELLRLYKQR